MNLDMIKEFFKDDRFATYLNIKIDEVAERTAKCTMTIDENFLNAKDTIHGGALFSLCDYTFAVASNAKAIVEKSGDVTVSQSAEIKYLKPGKGKTIRAEASFVSSESNKSLYEINVFDEKDVNICVSSVRGYTIKNK